MKKHEAIQHYKALSTNMLIADYVYCLQQNRKAAIAINSSLMLMFNGHKKLLDDNYIKEKVNYAVFESKHFFVIQDEIKKRVGEWTLTQEYYEERLKEEMSHWEVFKQTI